MSRCSAVYSVVSFPEVNDLISLDQTPCTEVLPSGPKLYLSTMCCSIKYPCPHHRGSLELPRGRGVLKANIFKGKYEPKLEFPEGWGVQTEKTSMGGELEQHNACHHLGV